MKTVGPVQHKSCRSMVKRIKWGNNRQNKQINIKIVKIVQLRFNQAYIMLRRRGKSQKWKNSSTKTQIILTSRVKDRKWGTKQNKRYR